MNPDGDWSQNTLAFSLQVNKRFLFLESDVFPDCCCLHYLFLGHLLLLYFAFHLHLQLVLLHVSDSFGIFNQLHEVRRDCCRHKTKLLTKTKVKWKNNVISSTNNMNLFAHVSPSTPTGMSKSIFKIISVKKWKMQHMPG